MADPTLATPVLPAGFRTERLFNCPPAHTTTFCTSRRTVANSLSFTAPVNQKSNIDATAVPVNLAPQVFTTIRMERLHKVLPANNSFVTGNDTAAAAIVWPAPAYPHANACTYP